MAKNQKGPVEQVRAKKAKSAKQIARKAENEAKAKMRLVALQATQRLCNEMRKQGHIGSEQTLLRIVAEKDRSEEQRKAREFVESVLAGPNGKQITQWMGSRIKGEPTKVAMILRNYLRTQGYREAV